MREFSEHFCLPNTIHLKSELLKERKLYFEVRTITGILVLNDSICGFASGTIGEDGTNRTKYLWSQVPHKWCSLPQMLPRRMKSYISDNSKNLYWLYQSVSLSFYKPFTLNIREYDTGVWKVCSSVLGNVLKKIVPSYSIRRNISLIEVLTKWFFSSRILSFWVWR